MTKLSIIIPCYNEEENLKRGVLQEVSDYLEKQKITYEVLICNDVSTDNSPKLIKDFVKTHPHFSLLDLPQKGGKPGGLWWGVQHAKYPHVLFTDMDQSTPISQLPKLLKELDLGADIAIGSRGLTRDGYGVLRKMGSQVFSFFRNTALGTNIGDTQCGFKAIKTELARTIFPLLAVIKNIQRPQGWRVTAYDVEMLFIAQKMGRSIKEVDVEWQNEDTSTTKGEANSRYIRESKQMIQEVLRIMANNLQGKYDFKKSK